jgi:penicillin-binding protein 2
VTTKLTWFLKGLLVLTFSVLLARLVELQIIKRGYFRSLAEGNRIRRVVIEAPRGQILARGGEVLAGNLPVEKKVVFTSSGEIEKTADFTEAAPEETLTEFKRQYFYGATFAHAVGYLGQVNADEAGKIDPKCPEKGPRLAGTLTGRSGLEEYYDCFLRGTDGEELIEVDIRGKMVRVLGRRPAVPGKDLKTHLDVGLQEKAAREMAGKKGAVVVSDAQNQILTLYSAPSFNPDKVSTFLNDADLPLFNRATSGLYHPGSVFKPVVALAALGEGKIKPDFTFLDPGVIQVGIYSYANWYFTQFGRTEGKIGLERALARSTDTFFYKLGEFVGIEDLAKWAGKFNLDKETGIDLNGEAAGLVPTPAWKLKVGGGQWFLGNTYHVAIGQGELALTPLAVNRETAAIANRGVWCRPEIAVNSQGEVKDNCRDLKIDTVYLNLVKAGMKAVCQTGGTGDTFFGLPDDQQVACKTGTAETNDDGKTHAWFTLFWPVDFPQLVVTVLVEGGGEGSKVAGPIAREIMDYEWTGKTP